MSKTVKQITKIKLKDSGLKGIEVTYTYPQEKDNMIWANEHVEKRKHPIHGDLKNAINDLRNFMLEGAGYYTEDISKEDKDYLIEDCKIIEINLTNDMFKLSGELRTIGDKFVKVQTPKIEQADGYAHFDAVVGILKVILNEAHEYMAGKKKLDESAYLMEYAKIKKDDVLVAEFSGMSNKEKQDKCREILEKMGGIVLINEELDVNEMPPIDFENVKEEGPTGTNGPDDSGLNGLAGITMKETLNVVTDKVLTAETAKEIISSIPSENKNHVAEIVPLPNPMPMFDANQAEKIPTTQSVPVAQPIKMPAF